MKEDQRTKRTPSENKKRLDVFLKASCLVSRRTVANHMCEAGLVKLNGGTAKPAKEVKIGDVIELRRGSKEIAIRVLEIPDKQLSKKQARKLYEIIHEKPIENNLDL